MRERYSPCRRRNKTGRSGRHGHEKGPVPAAVRGGRGPSFAFSGCADVACRCLGVKWVSVLLHRVPKNRPCIGVHPEWVAWCRRGRCFRSWRRGRSFRFLRLHIQGALTGSACRRIGIIFPVALDGSVTAPHRRREVLARQAWHKLHSAPCPALGGKRWWWAAACLPCHRIGGFPEWTSPMHAS